MNKSESIILIGMPGAGKTTVGRIVAAKLGWDFCDIDRYIEQAHQTTVAKLFEQGEAYFRQIESSAVGDLSRLQEMVIATGGGVVTCPENMALLKQAGVVIWLERPLEMILASCSLAARPLLAGNGTRLYDLYQERKELYAAYSDYRVMNADLPAGAADRIVAIKKRLEAGD